MLDWLTTTALAAALGGSGGYTETELLARYPVLAAVAVTLFVLGLTCDVYLLLRLARVRNDRRTRYVSLQKITAKPWTMTELGIVVSALMAAFVVFVLTARGLGWDKREALPVVLAVEAMLRIGALGGLGWWLSQRCVRWSEAFGLRRATTLPAIRDGVMFYLAVLIPFAVVVAVQSQLCDLLHVPRSPQPIAELFVTSDSTWAVVWIAVMALVVAPLFEEALFRGFAYPAVKQWWGAGPALVVVAAVFALIHFHLPSFLPLFTLACGFGMAYEWSGSLLTPITMHVLFNGANVVMLLYARWH